MHKKKRKTKVKKLLTILLLLLKTLPLRYEKIHVFNHFLECFF